jgi:hypothetical protein
MSRRLLIIAASLIVILGLIAVGYLLFSGSAELTVSDDPFAGTETTGSVIPEAASGAGDEVSPGLIRITNNFVAEGFVAIPRISTTTGPVSSDGATSTPDEVVIQDTEIRFIDRASGNIYRFMAQERALARISNKTLPGIQRASWLPDGTRAYVQFLSGDEGSEFVATYMLPETGEGGFFLEQGLRAALAVGSDSLFTLLSGTTGSVGSVAQADGTNTRTLFTSPISSLVVQPTNDSYFAHTKASSQIDGYSFQINATSGAFTRLLGPLRGLASLPSPDSSRLLYSYLDRGTTRLAVLDVTSRSPTALPLATLPEKCVWAPDSSAVYCAVPTSLPRVLPDAWYQGAVVLSDRIWRISMTDRLATLVVDPGAVADVSIDAVALTLDPNQDVLVFTDKHNGSLWMYDL